MGHHFSTELARAHPQLDLTDIYAFKSDLPGATCLVLIANPKSKVGASDNLSPEAVYKIGLCADKQCRGGAIYTVRFGADGATVGVIQGTDDSPGFTGDDIGVAQPNEVSELPGGLQFWTGTVRDPFFGNQNGLSELREAFAKGALDLDAFRRHAGQSPFVGIVSSAIVLEIPNASLTPSIYYYASVDWRDHGHWHRANRVAHVLVPHLYLFSTTDAQRSARHEHLPAFDDRWRSLAAQTIETYTRLAGFQSDPRSLCEAHRRDNFARRRALSDWVRGAIRRPTAPTAESFPTTRWTPRSRGS